MQSVGETIPRQASPPHTTESDVVVLSAVTTFEIPRPVAVDVVVLVGVVLIVVVRVTVTTVAVDVGVGVMVET
jgi:hypothetical protein